VKPLAAAIVLAALVVGIPSSAASQAAPDDTRSPAIATAAAVVPTVAGGALLGSAYFVDDATTRNALLIAGLATLTIGPSAGHVYAGAPRLGLTTAGIRVAVVALVGATLYLSDRYYPDDDGARGLVLLLDIAVVGAGSIHFAGSVGVDIFNAAPAARKHNRGLVVTPALVPAAGGAAPGLSLAGTF
jgi:hypothetical protein